MDQIKSQSQMQHHLDNHYLMHSSLPEHQEDSRQAFQQSQQQKMIANVKSEQNGDGNCSVVRMLTEPVNDIKNHQQLQQFSDNNNSNNMMQQLMILVQKTHQTDTLVQANREVYQNFVIQLQTRSRMVSSINYAERATHYMTGMNNNTNQISNHLNNSNSEYNLERTKRELHTLEGLLRQKAGQLNNIRRQIIRSHYEIFDELLFLQNKTLNEYLPLWQHEQQLSNNGAKIETISLDTIQSWVEKIVEIIWRIKNQIKGLQLTLVDKPNVPFDTEDLEKFVIYINQALENLIVNSFVVEKQPPQVMKTNTKFTSAVRFLCGNKLNIQLINPTVKALILSESNARTVIRYHKELIERSRSPFDDNTPPHNIATNQKNQNNHQQQQQQQQQQLYQTSPSSNSSGVLSPESSITQNPDGMMVEQSQSYGGAANHNHHLEGSPDQQQQHQNQNQPRFQQDSQVRQTQNHQTFNQTQHQSVPAAITGPLNMTPQQQYFKSITEIGYNPDMSVYLRDFESSGEILNNSSILEYQEQTGHMVGYFRNMQLKKIKRTEKKGTESVMDEKFVLLIYTAFRVADDSFWPNTNSDQASSQVKRGDLLFNLLAFSLPVVVIVHGNQEPHAWATITWHNAFAVPDEVLYKVPDRVTWRELGGVLSEKFSSCAGRSLSKQNLKYLAGKVYRNTVDDEEVLISWNQFSKESLADRSFTFWEWFHSILKLTREYLRDLWRVDRIWGFVGKKGCVDLLLGSESTEPTPPGTFLLRYSETELGGITIAWVSNSADASKNPTLESKVQISHKAVSNDSNPNVVMHLQPFLSNDLKTRSLADRIRDLKDLVYLYPNIPKDEAFGPYYTPISDCVNGSYIRSILVTTIAANYPGSSDYNSSQSSNDLELSEGESAKKKSYSGNGSHINSRVSLAAGDQQASNTTTHNTNSTNNQPITSAGTTPTTTTSTVLSGGSDLANKQTVAHISGTTNNQTNAQNSAIIDSQTTAPASDSQCPPVEFFHDNIPMGDVMERGYPIWDPVTGEFTTYSIQ